MLDGDRKVAASAQDGTEKGEVSVREATFGLFRAFGLTR